MHSKPREMDKQAREIAEKHKSNREIAEKHKLNLPWKFEPWEVHHSRGNTFRNTGCWRSRDEGLEEEAQEEGNPNNSQSDRFRLVNLLGELKKKREINSYTPPPPTEPIRATLIGPTKKEWHMFGLYNLLAVNVGSCHQSSRNTMQASSLECQWALLSSLMLAASEALPVAHISSSLARKCLGFPPAPLLLIMLTLLPPAWPPSPPLCSPCTARV